MPLSSAVNAILINEASAGGVTTLVTLTDIEVNMGSFEDQTDTVPVGDKSDYRVGARQAISFTVYVNGSGANGFGHIGAQDLYADMLTGTSKRVDFLFDGASGTYRYDPVKYFIVPRLGVLDQDKSALHINDAGTSGNPGAGGWTDLGQIVGGSSPSFEIVSVNNGLGQPIYSRMKMSWEVDLFTEGSASIDAFTGKLKVAIARGTSTETYIMFDDVTYFELPGYGEEFVTSHLVLSAAWADPRGDGKMVWPTLEDHLAGFEFRGVSSGSAKSDFLTITP